MKWGDILPKHKCASKLWGGGVEVMLTREIIASFSIISCLYLAPDFLFSWLSSKYCSSWRARASCSDSALVTVRSSWADSESLHPAEKKPHFETLEFKPASTRHASPDPKLTFHCSAPASFYEPPAPADSFLQSPPLVPWPEFCKASEGRRTRRLLTHDFALESRRRTQDVNSRKNTVQLQAGPEVPSSVLHCLYIV